MHNAGTPAPASPARDAIDDNTNINDDNDDSKKITSLTTDADIDISHKRYKQMMKDDNQTTTATTTTSHHDRYYHDRNSNRYKNSNNIRNRSLILFSPEQCHSVVSQQRMAPVYIGIPPIRPETDRSITTTSTSINKRIKMTNNIIQQQSEIVYKVLNADGTERRMTAQEKKLAKLQHKLRLKEQQIHQKHASNNEILESEGLRNPSNANVSNSNGNIDDVDLNGNDTSDDRYVPIHRKDDAKLHESEEHATDRDRIPPVMLPPSLAQCILPTLTRQTTTTPNTNDNDTTPSIRIEMDIELSKLWGQSLLQHSILPAEYERQQETNIRSMPYHIVPEVWTRLRPKFYTGMNDSENRNHDDDEMVKYVNNDEGKNNNEDNSSDACHSQDWMWCNMNAPISDDIEDADITNRHAILQFLHHPQQAPKLHISDGTKFGCDFLLYDGPRHERHAFAGLRILPPATQQQQQNHNCVATNTTATSSKVLKCENDNDQVRFPIHPNPYDLAGYVRCLNTAGKLALLATSVLVNDTTTNDTTQPQPPPRKHQCRKILIVDLALEKVAMTTSRRPKKTMEQRLKNLSKATKASK